MVVTGIGCVTALGNGRDSTWAGIREARCGIGPMTLFDVSGYRTQTAAQAWEFDPSQTVPKATRRRSSRADQLADAAASEALADAGINDSDRNSIAVVLGAGAGGMLEAEGFHRALLAGTWRGRRLSSLVSHSPSAATDFVALRQRLGGPRATISTACSSSATAIGYAADLVRSGHAPLALAGGAEALCHLTYSGFNSLRAVDPGHCRPFDKNRAGLSLGECGAMLLLEDADRARSRGATIYAEVAGYATSGDAHHMTAPDPGGGGAVRAIQGALQDAELSAGDVDYVNAHGTGTPANDSAETLAIRGALGKRAEEIPVSSSKSQIGHCLGAAGAIEAVITALSIHAGFIPATVGLETADPACDLDFVPGRPRAGTIRAALSNSFAFGGNNTVLVFRRA